MGTCKYSETLWSGVEETLPSLPESKVNQRYPSEGPRGLFYLGLYSPHGLCFLGRERVTTNYLKDRLFAVGGPDSTRLRVQEDSGGGTRR